MNHPIPFLEKSLLYDTTLFLYSEGPKFSLSV